LNGPVGGKGTLTNDKIKIREELTQAFLKTNFQWHSREFLQTPEGQNELEEHLFRRFDHCSVYTIPWVQRYYDLRGKTVLEIGCGSGSISAAIARTAGHVFGFDIHEASIDAARERVKVLDIGNVEFILSRPGEVVADVAKLAAQHKVHAVILHALLEHQTIAERIETLKLAWDIIDDDGIVIISESPNRISFYDDHTSYLHFFHMLPDDLALRYYTRSPRVGFRNDIAAGLSISNEEACLRLARFGRGVSYHEFELVFGSIGDHIVLDGYEPEMLQLRGGLKEEEIFLYRYFRKQGLEIPASFSKRYLDFVLCKKKVDEHRKQQRLVEIESINLGLQNDEMLRMRGEIARLTSSLSWRITTPLRWVKFRLKKAAAAFRTK
jgi:2-polyprenyl-3-methyl-5-hydroxy-6-metoxy-1,4-benzoquinol methylase